VRSSPTTLVNARAGYRFENGMRLQPRRLQPVQRQGEPDRVLLRVPLASEPSGVATFDRHIHPVEPLAIRLTLAGPL
jgi:hypothetical protein